MPGPYEDDDVEDVYNIFGGGSAVAEEDDVEDVYGIFKPPSKLASREPMGPPAPPKEWWEDIIDNVNDTVGTEKGRASGWRAALQGASQNTADNLTRWASPEFADSLDQAAKDSPVMHGLGQAGTGIAAGYLAGPAIGMQMLAQGGLSALSAAADGESFLPSGASGAQGPKMGWGASGAGGAVLGAGGQMVSNVVGKTARAIGGTEAGKWAGKQLGRLMPGADDAARAVETPAARLAREEAEYAAEYAGRSAPRAAPPAPAPSGPPPTTAPGEDEEALIELLYRKRPPTVDVPYEPPPLPEYPPPITGYEPPTGTWPPDVGYRSVVQGKGGRFAKRVPMDFEIAENGRVPGYDVGAKIDPLYGVNPPHPPPPVPPGERLLRMDAPEPPRKPATLSEPPLPIDEPPVPMPRAERPYSFAPEGPALEPSAASAPVAPWHRNFNDPQPIPRPLDLARPAPDAPVQRTMFHDLHDTLKFSPTYRKAAGAMKLADRALDTVGGRETGLAAEAGRAGFELAQETGLPGIFDQKVNAQDRMSVLSEDDENALDDLEGWPPKPPPTTVAERDVLAELAGGATAFGQGVGFNMIDDLFDATGQKPSADYVREQAERHPDAADMGSFWRSATAAAAAPGTVAAQGLGLGINGFVGEYGESGDLEKAALAGGLDGAVSANGALVGRGLNAASDKVQGFLRGPFAREMGSYLQTYDDPAMHKAAAGVNALLGRSSQHMSYAKAPGQRAAVQGAHHYWDRPSEHPTDNTLAPAQEERAPVADAPTLHYALQATLASGRAGLSEEDERALTEAVVAGDQSAISATDFRLRQRYPAYARAVERELRSYNEETF